MAGFATYEPAVEKLPNRGPFGLLLAGTLGAVRDEELAALRVAMLSRLPARCPVDALQYVGQTMAIERYAADTDDSYRARLVAAWPTWQEAGSPQAIVDQLGAFGLPEVRVYLDFDGHFSDGSWYSRFDVHLGPDYGALAWTPMQMPFTLGPSAPGGPGTLGSSATRIQVVTVKKILLKWKCAHSYPVRVVLRWPLTTLLGVTPTGPLQMPFLLGGTHESCRWPLGKLFGEQWFSNMPFTMGGFIL